MIGSVYYFKLGTYTFGIIRLDETVLGQAVLEETTYHHTTLSCCFSCITHQTKWWNRISKSSHIHFSNLSPLNVCIPIRPVVNVIKPFWEEI